MPRQQHSKPIILGIIIDASSSMAENWNVHGRTIPRLAVIKDSINKQLLRISDLYSLNDNRSKKAELFCIALGIRIPLVKYNKGVVGGYQPIPKKQKETILHGEYVCDLLSLIEIMPTIDEMSAIEAGLNTKWNEYTQRILSNINMADNIYEELRVHICSALQETAHDTLRRSYKYKIHSSLLRKESQNKSVLLSLPQKIFEGYIAYWTRKIETDSNREGNRYFNSILRGSQSIFERHKHRYEQYINQRLQSFVTKRAAEILGSLAIGYTVSDVIALFEEKRAIELAKEIYDHLDRDIRYRISPLWTFNNARLFLRKMDLRGRLEFKQVNKLAEDSIRKCTWSLLEPMVKTIIRDLFARSFKEQATLMLPYWLSLAASRETTKAMHQVAAAFPDLYEETFYSTDYLFGGTPMIEALDRASIRLLDNKYRNWVKVLIIISDGEYTDDRPIDAAERLKKKGIKIIGCCVADKDITRKLTKQPAKNWPEGTRTLFKMSSPIDLQDDFEQRFATIVSGLPEGTMMFFQINETETLENLLGLVLLDDDMVAY